MRDGTGTPPDPEVDPLEYDRPPFVMVPVALARLTGEQVRLYLALGAYCNGRTGTGAFPGVPRLSRDLERSQSTVRTDLRALETAGWLDTWPRRRDNGSQTTNGYRLRSTPRPLTGGGPTDTPVGPPPTDRRPVTRPTRTRTGTSGAPSSAVALTGDVLPAVQSERGTARDLVAAWVDGYTADKGEAPPSSVVRRVSGSARTVAQDKSVQWPRALACADGAGRRAFTDLVRALLDPPGTRSTLSPMQATLARAMERAQSAEDGGGAR